LTASASTTWSGCTGSTCGQPTADERSQSLLGAKLLGIYLASGIEVIAEDLGTVPDFVRWSMARLGVPGFKVMRWERAWNEPGQPPIDPGAFPEASVALSGTHDTESLAQWWRELAEKERSSWLELPAFRGAALSVEAPFVPGVRDALLRGLLGAASRYVMIPLQDVFGWDVRVNTPATVTEANWTWRVPVPVDRWREAADWTDRAQTLAEWSRAARRGV
jgi:4-alpha-glucanotransferase